MRLTLRTLLAYLDDVLEPAQTKEIGQKIQESPVAEALVSRVREVIRRRRLGAPDVRGSGQGIDPNVVAQYLDNTLPPDRVADVERVCLESDVHLAEVAACHEILSLVLGEPVEIPSTQLERFYALGPVSPDTQLQAAPEPPRRAAAPTPVASLSPERSFQEGLPDYLKPAPWSQRFAPIAGIAVILIAAIGALAVDPTLTQTLMGIQPEPQQSAETATSSPLNDKQPLLADSGTPGQSGGAGPGEASRIPKSEAAGDGIALTAQPASNLPTPPAGLDPAPPPDGVAAMSPAGASPPTVPLSGVPTVALTPDAVSAVAATPPTPANPASTNPSMTAAGTPLPGGTATSSTVATPGIASTATAPMPSPMTTTTPTTAPTGPPTIPPMSEPRERIFVPMQYTSTEGVLLRYQPADQHWFVQPRRSELHPEERFACPEPFEAQWDLDGGRLQVTLLGNTVMEILPPTAEQRLQLELVNGRVIFSQGLAAAEPPLTLRLQTGPQSWTIALTAPKTVLALERQWVRPQGSPLPGPPDQARLLAVVVSGSATFQAGDQAEIPLAGGEYRWLMQPAGAPPATLNALPTWVDPQQRQASATLRRYLLLFEREFDPTSAVDLSIPALIRDPRPKISELATLCLGTTGSISELTKALVRSEHSESRAAAAAGIRAWLIQDPARAGELKQHLQTLYSGNEGEAVERLLIGFSPSDAQDRLTSLQIVDWLRSNFVEVRELAIEQLELLTGRRYDFRPLGSPSQREPGIQRWMGHIDREGALVKPQQ